LSSNPYDYGSCPQCGEGKLELRHKQPSYSALLVVELGRLDGGLTGGAVAPSRLPWRLQVAPTMHLHVDGESCVYAAAAVVYNDGAHWWADLLAAGHFRTMKDGQPKGRASYRYDGLEAAGRLRFTSWGKRGPTLTSDERHISFVLYRRQAPPGGAPSTAMRCTSPSPSRPARAPTGEGANTDASDGPRAGTVALPESARLLPPPAPAAASRPASFEMPGLYRSLSDDASTRAFERQQVAHAKTERATAMAAGARPNAPDDDQQGAVPPAMPYAAQTVQLSSSDSARKRKRKRDRAAAMGRNRAVEDL